MSPIKFKGQHWMSLAMVAVSAWVIFSALRWPFKAALFPAIIGFSVFGMSLTELFMSLRQKEKTKKRHAIDFSLSEDVDPAVAMRRTFMAFAWIIAFFALVVLFSFNLAIVLFVFLFVKIQGREKWWTAATMTAAAWGFFWALFIKLLETPMPDGLVWRALGMG